MRKTVFCIVFCVLSMVNAWAQLSFDEPVSYSVGSFSSSITKADFDNDGKLDLAVVNSDDKNISILINKGDGTFKSAVNYNAVSCTGIVAADLNSDGFVDLATSGDSVTVLLNSGNGTFPTFKRYLTGFYCNDIVAADYNGDGKLDLATPVYLINILVAVLINNGNGTFGAAQYYRASPRVDDCDMHIATGDFNGDGKADLVVPGAGLDSVSVYLNKGDGTFADSVNYKTGAYPSSTVAVDINGDSKTDIISACASANSTSLSVLINNGSGFNLPVKYPFYSTGVIGNVVSTDINSDQKPDFIVIGGEDWDTIHFFTNQGNGQLIKTSKLIQPIYSYSLVAGDFNGDNKIDIASANPQNFISVFLQSTSTSLIASNPISEIQVYPNPVSTILNIKPSNALEDLNVMLYDNMGKLVKSYQMGKEELEIDVSDLARGMYWIRNEGSETTVKGYPIIVE